MPNLSQAWLSAVERFKEPGGSLHSLSVMVDEFDDQGLPLEDDGFRDRLDAMLVECIAPSVGTTASTIFPFSHRAVLAAARRGDLYARYERIIPTIRKHPLNRNGVYFERMVMFPSYDAPEEARINQLENILSFWEHSGRRKSAFQVCIYRPEKDWTKQPYAQFPCLQHVAFTPTSDGLHMSAFYATQYLIKRGYGNYLGLCRLGAFVAHEMEIRMRSLVCYAAHAPLEGTKRDLDRLLRRVKQLD